MGVESSRRASSRGVSGRSPQLALAAFLPYRLNVAAALVSEGLARAYSERFGIGVPEWRVLATTAEFGRITATAIGLHAHMSKVKVSRAAAALAERGLVRRLRNEADLREAFLALTPAGEEMHREIVPLALGYVDRLTAGLDERERVALNRLLDKLAQRAVEMGTAPD